ncbi:MAG: hypothetical protein IPM07_26400 [Anaerolineales bacterium]|nr:hypothetical protein [Anaerolineales bacterium]
MVSKQTWRVDLLLLLGMAILGYGLWLDFGDAAALMYTGTAMFAMGVILSTGQRGNQS